MEIRKNFVAVVSKMGKVIAITYMNSLHALAFLRQKHKDCEIEVYDVSEYGQTFEDASKKKAERTQKVRRKSDGKVWNSTRDCREDIKVTNRSLLTALKNGTSLRDEYYEYV